MSSNSSGDLVDKLLRSGARTLVSSTPRGQKYEAMLAETASQATSTLLESQDDQTHPQQMRPSDMWRQPSRSPRLASTSHQRSHLPAKVVFLRWWLDTFGYSKPLRTAWEDETYCSPRLSATESFQKSHQQSPTFIRGVCMSRDSSAESVTPVLQQETEPSASMSWLSQSYNDSSHASRWLSTTDSRRPQLKPDPTGPSMAAVDYNPQPSLVAAGQSSETAQGSKARQGRKSFPHEGGRIDSSSPPKTTPRCGQDQNASSNVLTTHKQICQPCNQDSLSKVEGDYTQDTNFLCSFARQNQAWAEGNMTHRQYHSHQMSETQPKDDRQLNGDTEQEFTACVIPQADKGKTTTQPCKLSKGVAYCQAQEHNDMTKLSNLTAIVTPTELVMDACHNNAALNLSYESKLTSPTISFPLRNYNSIQLEKSMQFSNQMRKCKLLYSDLKRHNNSCGDEENSSSKSNMSYFRQLAAKRSRKDENDNQHANTINHEYFHADNFQVACATSNKDQVKSEAACLPTNLEPAKLFGIQTTVLNPQFSQLTTIKTSMASNISFPGSYSNHELGKCIKSHATTEERCLMGMAHSDKRPTASNKEASSQECTRKHAMVEPVNTYQEQYHDNDSDRISDLQQDSHSCHISMASRSNTYLTPRKKIAYRSVIQQRSQSDISSALPQRSQSDISSVLPQRSQSDIGSVLPQRSESGISSVLPRRFQSDISFTTRRHVHDRGVKMNIFPNVDHPPLRKAFSDELYLTTYREKEHYIKTNTDFQCCKSILHPANNETTSMMKEIATPVIREIQNMLKQGNKEGAQAGNVLQQNALKESEEECHAGNVLQQNADKDAQHVREPEDNTAASTQSELNKYNAKSSPAESELNKHNVKCPPAQYLPRQNNETVSPEPVQLDSDRKTTQDQDLLNQNTHKMSPTLPESTLSYHRATIAHIVQQQTNDKVSLVSNVDRQNNGRSQLVQSVGVQESGQTLQAQYSHRHKNNDTAAVVPNVQPQKINEMSLDKKTQKLFTDKNSLARNVQNQNNAKTLLIQKECENNYTSPLVQNAPKQNHQTSSLVQPVLLCINEDLAMGVGAQTKLVVPLETVPPARTFCNSDCLDKVGRRALQPLVGTIKCSRAAIESQLQALLVGSRLKTRQQEAEHCMSSTLPPNEDIPTSSKSNHEFRSSVTNSFMNNGIFNSNNTSTKSSPEQIVNMNQPNKHKEYIEQKPVNYKSVYDKLGSMKTPDCPGVPHDVDFSLETLALQKLKASPMSDASENMADLSEVRSSPSPPHSTIKKKNPVFPRPRPNALGFTDPEKLNPSSRPPSHQPADSHMFEFPVSICRKQHHHKQASLKINVKRKLRVSENVPLCQHSKGLNSKSGGIPVPHRTTHEGCLLKAAPLKVLPPLESLLAIQENPVTKLASSNDDKENSEAQAKLAQWSYFGTASKSQEDVELTSLDDPRKGQTFILVDAQTLLSLRQKCDRFKNTALEPTFKIQQWSSSPGGNPTKASTNTLLASHICNLQQSQFKEDNTWDNSREESSLEASRPSLPVDRSFTQPSCPNRYAGKRKPGLLPEILNMERDVHSRKYDGRILDTSLVATSNEDSRELLQSKHDMSMEHRTSDAVRSKGETGSSMMIEDIEHSTTGDSTQIRGQELEGKFTKKGRRIAKKLRKEITPKTPPLTFLNMLLSDELKLDEQQMN